MSSCSTVRSPGSYESPVSPLSMFHRFCQNTELLHATLSHVWFDDAMELHGGLCFEGAFSPPYAFRSNLWLQSYFNSLAFTPRITSGLKLDPGIDLRSARPAELLNPTRLQKPQELPPKNTTAEIEPSFSTGHHTEVEICLNPAPVEQHCYAWWLTLGYLPYLSGRVKATKRGSSAQRTINT